MNDFPSPCDAWAEAISLAAAGCLEADEDQAVRRHLETCSQCRDRYGELLPLCAVLAEAELPAERAEAAIVARVRSEVASAASPRMPLGAEQGLSKLVSRSRDTWRWLMRAPVSRVAASVAFVLVGAAVTVWFHGVGAALAFADFTAPLLKAKTVRYKMVVETKGPPARTSTSQQMVLDATRSRHEMTTPGQLITISDEGQGKGLTLDPKTKQATILEFDSPSGLHNDPSFWLRRLQEAWNHTDVRSEPLGEKELEGRRVVGFRVVDDDGRATYLRGDPQSGLPVRIEMTMGMGDSTRITYSDFVFDEEMDEALFRIEPPAGYTVQHKKVASSPPPQESDLVEAFREYRAWTGTFPRLSGSANGPRFFGSRPSSRCVGRRSHPPTARPTRSKSFNWRRKCSRSRRNPAPKIRLRSRVQISSNRLVRWPRRFSLPCPGWPEKPPGRRPPKNKKRGTRNSGTPSNT